MKKELRKEFLNKRDNLSEDYRQTASNSIFELLEKNSLFREAESIFIYIGFGSEIQTENFIKKHLTNKKIFVPKIVNKEMELVHITSWDNLEAGHFNILEPASNIFYNGPIDLVITPSIVFDKHGFRLGYGKGYYDKYFTQNKHKTSIGLSYNKLLQENIPTESHDRKVDFIITEEGTVEC